MSDLTPADIATLRTLHAKWTSARAEKDWPAADAMRAELIAWGCMGANLEKWHPVFESCAHRENRIK